MKDELSTQELNLIVFGQPPVVEAEFYDREVLDVSASRAAGERIMRTAVYIHHWCTKEKVDGHRPVQAVDKQRHKAEWQKYSESKENERLRQVQTERETSPIGHLAEAKAG